jgi:anion-transporting  ArsA/GET3 family ATPase
MDKLMLHLVSTLSGLAVRKIVKTSLLKVNKKIQSEYIRLRENSAHAECTVTAIDIITECDGKTDEVDALYDEIEELQSTAATNSGRTKSAKVRVTPEKKAEYEHQKKFTLTQIEQFYTTQHSTDVHNIAKWLDGAPTRTLYYVCHLCKDAKPLNQRTIPLQKHIDTKHPDAMQHRRTCRTPTTVSS